MKPILCVIDIQKEYSTPDRPFYISGLEASLTNAKSLLSYARKNDWQIIHVQHLQDGSIFSRTNEFSQFVDGFEPCDGELVCIKENFSSFSSLEFTTALLEKKQNEIFVIGYGSTMCCLSTIIDGYHRGFKFTFVADASNAKPTANFTSANLHNSATEILRTFGNVKNVSDIIS